ncbi:MAG: hypothetical protein IT567_04740 [Alphaproteobacteria bacterium]|nr:hypothetical protein [Alphaproteobacteria bacterium]
MATPALVAPPPSPEALHEAWREAWQEAVTQQHTGSPFASDQAEEEAYGSAPCVESPAEEAKAEVISFAPPSASSAMEDAWLAAWENAVALQDNKAPTPDNFADAPAAAASTTSLSFTIADNPDHPLHRGYTD